MKHMFWAALLSAACGALGAVTIDPAHANAYGANLGWLNWHPGSSGAVIGDYVCSGSIYVANCGWMSLGSGTPISGIRYANASASDFGVNHDGQGNLRGFAYAANLGWINFEGTGAPRVNLATGILGGYAYSANCGWISLSNAIAQLRTSILDPGADLDADGIADAWELLKFGSLAVADAASDADHDGASDRQEYLADTDPADPGDNLRIIQYLAPAHSAPASLTWTTRPTRGYRVEQTVDLLPLSWTDSGLGLIQPDGLTTTRTPSTTAASALFYRVEARRPLAGPPD
jgi:hypothetical protein